MNRLVLLIGGNRGNRLKMVSDVKQLVSSEIGEIIEQSLLYETEPWGFDDEQWFFNQVLIVSTELDVYKALEKTRSIENRLGRTRKTEDRYESRIIDIDLLFYNQEVVETEDLVVPHPRIQDRKFVLVPLAEVLPSFVHPVFNRSISDLLGECKDECAIREFEHGV